MTPNGVVRLFSFCTRMAAEYTLLMQKTASGSPLKSSLADFGFAIADLQWPDAETADVSVREWPGEDGEDVYIPVGGQKLKAYDVAADFCYKGELGTAYAKYKAFRDYLFGAGGFLKIYDPVWKIGRQNVYAKKVGDLEPFKTNVDEGIAFSVTFRVTDPITEVTAGTNTSGEIISLGAL